MADNTHDPRKISGMTPAFYVDGEEWIEILQDEENRKAQLKNLFGPKGNDGVDGKNAYELAILKGFNGTMSEWLESLNGTDGAKGDTGSKGDTGLSAYEIAQAEGFDGSRTEWLESLNGKDGDSAYKLAVDQGFVGNKDQWLESLKGDPGAKGDRGSPGIKGDRGDRGLSAYEIAVADGYNGTRLEWLNSLKGTDGTDGASAYEIAQTNGFTGTETQWLESLKGVDGVDGVNGNSAYEVAQVNGFTGTEVEWLESLNGTDGTDGVDGTDGADGASAYEIAQANGFTGTETQWLESLNGTDGTDGASAYEIALANGYVGSEEEFASGLTNSTVKIEVLDFSSLNVNANPDFTITKVYSDSSIQIQHNLGASPNGWFAINKESTPSVEIYPTTTTNMQVVDNNTVIITNVDAFNVFDVYLHFSDSVEITATDGTDGASAYEIAQTNGFTGTETQWLESLKGTDGVDGFLTVDGVNDVTEISFTGDGVNTTSTNGSTTVEITGGGTATSSPLPLRRTVTVQNNSVPANVTIVGYGEQTDLDSINISVTTGQLVTLSFTNTNNFIISSISVFYDAGWNDTAGFEIEYTSPFGDTDPLAMPIPLIQMYSHGEPSVVQAQTQHYYRVDPGTGLTYVGKSNLNAGQPMRWRFTLI